MTLEVKKAVDRILKNRRPFTYIEDPGHGWLLVTFDELDFLGLADDISPYSFMRDNGFVYLEEDRDAVMFVRKYEARYGNFEYQTKHRHSAECRNYKSYDPVMARHNNNQIVKAYDTV
jgi:hypothetical protein